MSEHIIRQVPRPVSRAPLKNLEKVFEPEKALKPAEPQTLTAKYLRSILHYDQETGVFTRAVRTSNRIQVGDTAGSVNGNGYIHIRVLGVLYPAHRLVWLYLHGEWPKHQIDHVDRDRLNNRAGNLREVTQQQNLKNKGTYSSNKSGHPGVHWYSRYSKWHAGISNNRKNIDLGYYDTIEEAVAARKAGELRYWGVNRAD